jgi:hypothetical protein
MNKRTKAKNIGLSVVALMTLPLLASYLYLATGNKVAYPLQKEYAVNYDACVSEIHAYERDRDNKSLILAVNLEAENVTETDSLIGTFVIEESKVENNMAIFKNKRERLVVNFPDNCKLPPIKTITNNGE